MIIISARVVFRSYFSCCECNWLRKHWNWVAHHIAKEETEFWSEISYFSPRFRDWQESSINCVFLFFPVETMESNGLTLKVANSLILTNTDSEENCAQWYEIRDKPKRNKLNAYLRLINTKIKTEAGWCMRKRWPRRLIESVRQWYLPGLCVANKAPADTEVTRKLLKRSPRNASQRAAAFSKNRAAVFLSWYLQGNQKQEY